MNPSFRIRGLEAAPFAALFGLSDEELARHHARRYRVTTQPGFPDRISLSDAPLDSNVLLVNYTHQSADSPYRASHAIYVREAHCAAFDAIDTVPGALRGRLLSLRAFDGSGMMVDADICEGQAIEPLIGRLFSNPRVEYIHAHFANRGCFACRIDRA